MSAAIRIAFAVCVAGALAPRAPADELLPACRLLTADEAAALLGGDVAIAKSSGAMDDISECHWSGMSGADLLDAYASRPGGSDVAGDMFVYIVDGYARQGAVEHLAGIGDNAVLSETSSGGIAKINVAIFNRSRVVVLTGTGIAHDAMVSTARTAATRM